MCVAIKGSSSYTKLNLDNKKLLQGSRKFKQSLILFFFIKYSVIFYIIRFDPYLAVSSNSPNLTSALNKLVATKKKSLNNS